MQKILNIISANRLFGFLLVGGFNTIMGLLVYSLLLYFGVNYMLSSTLSFVFGVLEGYTLNSILVFRVMPKFHSLFKFTAVYCISLGLNLIMVYLLVEYAHLDKLIAQVITCVVLAGVNFYLIKAFVYRLHQIRDYK
jgi:putative flippase GtrA